MPDYIAPSLKLSEWLKEQGITFEVDEHAPVVWKDGFGATFVSVLGEVVTSQIVCPFFGPGGADNSAKALRAWCEKNNCYLALEDTKDGIVKWLLISEDTVEVGGTPMEPPEMEPAILIEGKGKTDGEALRDLLENLMEEKK